MKTHGAAPKCAFCGKRLKLAPDYIRERGRAMTTDGAPPHYGYEGNNLVCSQRCGFSVMLSILSADPAVLSILPPGWNKRARRDV
jgi:hypothetical protein